MWGSMVDIVVLLLNCLYLQSEYKNIYIQYSCVNSVLFKTDCTLFKGVISFFLTKIINYRIRGPTLINSKKNKRIDRRIKWTNCYITWNDCSNLF